MAAPATASPPTTELFADPRVLTDPRVLVDPREKLLADPRTITDPSVLPPKFWADLPNGGKRYRTLDEVAGGIAVAFLVMRLITKQDMALYPYNDRFHQGAQMYFDAITASKRATWNHMVVPAFQRAVQLGTVELSPEEEQVFATMFSNRLFDYINHTSADALMRNYEAQLAQKWNPDIAWARAVNGWGLDGQQTNRYIHALQSGETKRLIPYAAERLLARALGARADKIGMTEAHHARQMGQTLVWMRQGRAGLLPPGTKRRWVIRKKLACDVCKPMEGEEVGLEEQFTLPDGNKIWAPGVHPGCECEQVLVRPVSLQKAAWDEGEPRVQSGAHAGEWTAVMTREAEPEVETQTETAPATERVPVATRKPTAARVPVATRTPTAARQATSTRTPQAVRQPVATRTPTKARVPSKGRVPRPGRQPVPPRVPSHGDNDGYEPYYLFANDYYQARINPADRPDPADWPDGDDMHDYEVGDVIDFDKMEPAKARPGRAPETLVARPAINVRDMAYDAGHRYQAAGDFGDDGDNEMHASLMDLYDVAVTQAAEVVKHWDRHQLLEIYGEGDAAEFGSGLPDKELRSYLVDNVQRDGDLRDAYLSAIEREQYPIRDKTVLRAFDDYQQIADDRQQRGVPERTPTVFIFAQGHSGGFVDSYGHYDPDAIIEGKYEVARIEHRRTRLELGRDSPSTLAGMTMVYLVPTDDD